MRFPIRLWLFGFCLVPLLTGCGAKSHDQSAAEKLNLADIYAPVRVGTPPDNAFNGLVQLIDGEIRHYGYDGPQANPTHYFYIYSRDHALTWTRSASELSGEDAVDESRPPAARSPWSGDYIRLIGTRRGTFALRSSAGIDGPYTRSLVDSVGCSMVRQPMFLQNRRRVLVASQHEGQAVLQACVFYSDDDGRTWRESNVPVGPRFEAVWPHAKTRWQNYAIEPTVTELGDGRLWMLLRTSMDNLYESFSADGGESWSAPASSRFYSTLTTPTFFRLKDGRLLLFWCNTTPLPEVDRSADTTIREEQKNGDWEDVFTNRDAIHAAISEDDGQNWAGFRELYLDPLRNDSDFATRQGISGSLDRSVHQSQATELPGGKVLVALGQHPLVRALVIFDPAWLYDTARADSFDNGLGGWSTFRYVDGIKGHCAYNRDPGPPLEDSPDNPGRKALHLRHIPDSALVCDIDGAVWNFPAGRKGSFTTRIRPEPGGGGGRISLLDRWFNPTDTLAVRFAMYRLEFDGEGRIGGQPALSPGQWQELSLEWEDSQTGTCRVSVDGRRLEQALALNRPGGNGICYVQFQSLSRAEDRAGFRVGSVRAQVDGR